MKKIGLIILFISLVVTVSSSVNQQKVYRLPALAEEVNYDENCDSNNINILDSLYNSKDSIGREKERAKKEQEILLIKEEITKQNEYLEREKMIFFSSILAVFIFVLVVFVLLVKIVRKMQKD